MACENAIVSSDVGETRKLISEENGILVPLDSDRIAGAIKELILNPEKCGGMGYNARQKVLKEHSIQKYILYFKELIEDKNERV
jgi:glycosyltransferase involved in cell wall biosynthesis